MTKIDIDLYNKDTIIEFVKFIRHEIKFVNTERLKEQIKLDIKNIAWMEIENKW